MQKLALVGTNRTVSRAKFSCSFGQMILNPPKWWVPAGDPQIATADTLRAVGVCFVCLAMAEIEGVVPTFVRTVGEPYR